MKVIFAILVTILSTATNDISGWIESAFAKGTNPPFSFVFNGKKSSDTITRWKYSMVRENTDEGAPAQYVVSYMDPVTKLKVECNITGYDDFNAVDWVLHFTNASSRNSPVIENVRVIDFGTQTMGDGSCMNLRLQGSLASKEDFKPFVDTLSKGSSLRYSPRGGRSSDWDVCPYFNTILPEGGGIVTAVGWTGSWYEELSYDKSCLSIRAGMQKLQSFLHPGESIRTPMITMLFWEGNDFMTGCNLFRRFMLSHVMRQTNGQTTGIPTLAGVAWSDPFPCNERTCLTEEVAVTSIHRFGFFDLCPGVYWLDAGWYATNVIKDRTRNWENTAGTWRPDPSRFPNGFKPVSDAAHEQGAKLMVWFEPERACKGSYIAEKHPEWLLKAVDVSNPDYYMFNFGNRDARDWMCRYIGDFIEESGIDWYRQDNCFRDLRPYWDQNDEPGRTGMTEIRYIEGLYAFLDYLLERFPDILIDNCASGGRRLDIEMFRRSVPLWRTDFSGSHPSKDVGKQSHTYGLNFFIPVHGISNKSFDAYSFYSSLAPANNFGVSFLKSSNTSLDVAAERIRLYREIQPYLYEDYYPLTGLKGHTKESSWLSYQMHRPSDNSGIVLAFRHRDNKEEKLTVRLQGLDKKCDYYVLNQESQEMKVVSGKELSDGLTIEIKEAPGAVMLRYGVAESGGSE